MDCLKKTYDYSPQFGILILIIVINGSGVCILLS